MPTQPWTVTKIDTSQTNCHPVGQPAGNYVFPVAPVTFQITNTSATQLDLQCYAYDVNGAYIDSIPAVHPTPGQTVAVNFTNIYAAARQVAINENSSPAGTYTFNTISPDPAYGRCQYGSSPLPTSPNEVWVTGDMLRQALGSTVSEQLPVPTFTFAQQLYNVSGLCSAQPPDPPVITDGDILLAQSNPISWLVLMDKVGKWRDSWAFTQYCQCNAPPTGGGSTTVGPPPKPNLPNTPLVTPPSGCTTDDLCKRLDQVLWILEHSNNNQTHMVTTTNPVTYVNGPVHVVSGSGYISVAPSVAISISLSGLPPYLGSQPTSPRTIYTHCHVALGTSSGYQERIPLRHNPQLINLDGYVTSVGYDMLAGVTATIAELHAQTVT